MPGHAQIGARTTQQQGANLQEWWSQMACENFGAHITTEFAGK
jgi:hypothetical protein